MFATLLWTVFIVDSVLLVLIILLQSGRGGGLSGMLGGGGMAGSAIGPKTGLPKITSWMAAVFFIAAVLIGLVTHESASLDVKSPSGGKGSKKGGAEAPGAPGKKAGEPSKDAPQPAPGKKS